MKLIQLNLWMGKLLYPALQFIKDEQPDILCLQEVFDTDNTVILPDLMFNSLSHMKKRGNFEYSHFSPIINTSVANNRTNFGNAILSKYPLENVKTLFTNGDLTSDIDGGELVLNNQNLQLATVVFGDKKFTLANHHGYWKPSPVGDDTSVIMLHKVHNYIKDLPRPLILTGDLNVIPESKAMRPFDSYLEDLTTTHGISTTLSELGKVSGVACDHILVSPEVVVKSFRADSRLISDHLALVMEFDI